MAEHILTWRESYKQKKKGVWENSTFTQPLFCNCSPYAGLLWKFCVCIHIYEHIYTHSNILDSMNIVWGYFFKKWFKSTAGHTSVQVIEIPAQILFSFGSAQK